MRDVAVLRISDQEAHASSGRRLRANELLEIQVLGEEDAGVDKYATFTGRAVEEIPPDLTRYLRPRKVGVR